MKLYNTSTNVLLLNYKNQNETQKKLIITKEEEIVVMREVRNNAISTGKIMLNLFLLLLKSHNIIII